MKRVITAAIVICVPMLVLGCAGEEPTTGLGEEAPAAVFETGLSASASTASCETTTFIVDATFSDRIVLGFPHSGFQDTGVPIQVGDRIVMAASGEACVLPEGPCFGPDGSLISVLPAFPNYLVQDIDANSLVGRVGSGSPFVVGSSFNKISGQAGNLLLGFNDSRVDDNTGFFEVLIATNPPAGCNVAICHQPGTPGEQTQMLSVFAVARHLGQDDTLGECGQGGG